VYRMRNPIRRHAWGSPDAIPALLGFEPDGGPYAELWLSAHEDESSTVARGDNSEDRLCDLVHETTGRRLPFLAKVLAIGSPLSLQLHPRGALAKPEMLFALTRCTTLCGFRTAEQAHTLLDRLGVSALDPVAACLTTGDQGSLRAAMGALLQTKGDTRLTDEVMARLRASNGAPQEVLPAVQALAAQRSDDPAVLAPLLMSVIELSPGDAMFCAPGQPHTYLSGLGFEVQTNSDEVVRGGLTDKPVDVAAFVDGLNTLAGAARVTPGPDGPEDVFTPDAGFSLGVVRGVDGVLPSVPGPQILMCTDGEFRLVDGAGAIRLGRGDAAFAPGPETSVNACGSGLLLRVSGSRAG